MNTSTWPCITESCWSWQPSRQVYRLKQSIAGLTLVQTSRIELTSSCHIFLQQHPYHCFFDSFTSVKIFETHHTHQVQYFQPTHTGHIILHRIAYGMDVGPTAQQQGHGPRIHLSDTPPKFNMAPEKWWLEDKPFLSGRYISVFFVKLSGGMSNNYPCAELFEAFYPCTQRLEWTNMSSIISCHTCHSVWRLTDR